MIRIRGMLLFAAILTATTLPAAGGDIFTAAETGDAAAVRAILEAEPELAIARDKTHRYVETVLHRASAAGHVEIVTLLLDAGASVDAGDADDSTALDVAAQRGRTAVVKCLVERGATVTHADRNGMTPLHFASYEGHLAAAKYLIAAGARVNARTQASSLPLHGAASGGHADLCRLLVREGSEVDVVNDYGYAPLLSAAAGGDLAIVRLLVDKGADLHAKTTNGQSALLLACQSPRGNAVSLVHYLIGQGLDVNGGSHDGRFPLMESIWRGESNLCRLLIENGADVNAAGPFDRTALMAATHRGDMELIELLVDSGADVDASDRDGTTALLNLSIRGANAPAALLLEGGADVDLRDGNWERAPLHWAAVKGNATLAKELLARKADRSAKDISGATPLCLAQRYGHADVAALLAGKDGKTTAIASPDNASWLTRELADREALLWYLGHCGWAIRTRNHLLVFDYWNKGKDPAVPALANGHIDPAEIADSNVEVFVTHEHGDHFDPTILGWEKGVDDITFIFGFDPENATGEAAADGAACDWPAHEYIAPRSTRTIDGMEIVTIRANDAGVGFLVKVDGLAIYHAGDHAGWRDGEREGFMKEIDFLATVTDRVDFAFVNITGCHANDPSRLKAGNAYTLETLSPVVTVPTHALDREYLYTRFAEIAEARELKTKVLAPLNRGDRFRYGDDGAGPAIAD